MPKRDIGRPGMISRERIQRIRDAIAVDGSSDRVAAARGGINVRTFYYWKRRGEEALETYGEDELSTPLEEMPYVHFYREIMSADVDREEVLHGYIRAHAPGDWRAAHALLKMHNPEQYADRQKVKIDATVSGDPAKPVVAHVDVSGLGGPDALVELLRRAGRPVPGDPDTSKGVERFFDDSDKAGGE